MRFLILTQYYSPEFGAPQVRLAAVARELMSAGHKVEVVTGLPNHPTGRIFPEYTGNFYTRDNVEGVPVHRVWLYAATGAGLKRMWNYGSFALTSMWALARCKRPDYIIVESPPLFLSVPAFLAARLWRAKVIFNVADLWPDSVRELGLMKDGLVLRIADWLEAWSYRVSDKVNAVTEGIRTTLVQRKGVSPTKVTFLPNGVDTALFCPQLPDVDLAKKLGIAGKRIVLYAGTHGYAHGMEVALQAAGLLAHREDILFVFIGAGSEKDTLIEIARQTKLTNVLFLEPAAPAYVSRLYSLACAGLSTLRDSPLFEGTRPVKIFAAMSCAVPVLYCGDGEGARLVQNSNSGRVTPPENAEALATAVVELVDHPELSRELGTNGRRYVEAHLSWPALITDWLQQLEQH